MVSTNNGFQALVEVCSRGVAMNGILSSKSQHSFREVL
jgi:hypothetical protein